MHIAGTHYQGVQTREILAALDVLSRDLQVAAQRDAVRLGRDLEEAAADVRQSVVSGVRLMVSVAQPILNAPLWSR